MIETMPADEGLIWAYLYLESEKGPWHEIGRTVGRNIALNGARLITSAFAGMDTKQITAVGFAVTAAVAKCMAEGRDLADMAPPLRVRRDDRIAFARGMASGLGNPNRREQA